MATRKVREGLKQNGAAAYSRAASQFRNFVRDELEKRIQSSKVAEVQVDRAFCLV